MLTGEERKLIEEVRASTGPTAGRYLYWEAVYKLLAIIDRLAALEAERVELAERTLDLMRSVYQAECKEDRP